MFYQFSDLYNCCLASFIKKHPAFGEARKVKLLEKQDKKKSGKSGLNLPDSGEAGKLNSPGLYSLSGG